MEVDIGAAGRLGDQPGMICTHGMLSRSQGTTWQQSSIRTGQHEPGRSQAGFASQHLSLTHGSLAGQKQHQPLNTNKLVLRRSPDRVWTLVKGTFSRRLARAVRSGFMASIQPEAHQPGLFGVASSTQLPAHTAPAPGWRAPWQTRSSTAPSIVPEPHGPFHRSPHQQHRSSHRPCAWGQRSPRTHHHFGTHQGSGRAPRSHHPQPSPLWGRAVTNRALWAQGEWERAGDTQAHRASEGADHSLSLHLGREGKG